MFYLKNYKFNCWCFWSGKKKNASGPWKITTFLLETFLFIRLNQLHINLLVSAELYALYDSKKSQIASNEWDTSIHHSRRMHWRIISSINVHLSPTMLCNEPAWEHNVLLEFYVSCAWQIMSCTRLNISLCTKVAASKSSS